MNKNYFNNKVVWITGASSGIGEALVYLISKSNAKIIISARRIKELESVKQRCINPDNVFVLEMDLEKIEELQSKVEQAKNIYGKIDVLINNAGIGQRSLIKDTSIDVDKKIMNINYFGTIALTKYVLKDMIANNNGHIVTVSSLVGYFGTPYRSAYAASKHALHGFFDSLRAEVFKNNIKVTIICPGFIDTEIAVNALTSDGGFYGEKTKIPKGLGLSAEQCAKKIIDAIAKQKNESVIGGTEIIAVYIKKYFPYIFSKIMEKAKVI